ncbi:mitochondrial import receptor subunit [Niveomyces insectorum RCEF 264]|uniref:Mitochondrial import receptor subunit n=1 Tax=Niveomyces insectorum RCEF 264 TaxID=1081102 RepID=A0A167NA12_9HYPO|nr:mitochondrial import receptor subunit [Niveomyces insectorum RCEF 264]
MALELHVWGPAFGLPSIDPECLAAVAYLARAAPERAAWSLVATSPSAVPDTLPALRDAHTGRWVAAGFDAIVAYLRARTAETQSPFTDLDAGLDGSAAAAADTTAYAAFLRAEAGPLVSLSLYVSSANWAATTRPAYSRLLPFPLTWLEPPAVRAAHATRAAHLGLSSLDTDAEATAAAAAPTSSAWSHALHAFPDRLRSIRATTATTGTGAALTPEAKAQIRLDAAARACLTVLAARKGTKRLFLRPDKDDKDDDHDQGDEGDEGDDSTGRRPSSLRPSALDCLAFGYLALMAVPDVPRPFLRGALHRHAPGLVVFVADVRVACLGGAGDEVALPWKQKAPLFAFTSPFSVFTASPSPLSPASSPSSSHTLALVAQPSRPLWLRTLYNLVHSVPGPGGVCLSWLWRQVCADDDGGHAYNTTRRQRLVTLAGVLMGTALAAGLLVGYRRLPPFGSPVVVYKRVPRSLLELGVAGAMLSLSAL